jgi:nucleoside-diphosphate-sugar epimerase
VNSIPVFPITTPVADLVRGVDQANARSAVIVGTGGEFVCQLTLADIRRRLLTGLDLGSAVGTIAQASPLFLKEGDLPNGGGLSVVAEVEAAGFSHCPVVDGQGRYQRAASCAELLGTASRRRSEAAVRHALVIGGAGYLGTVLVQELLDAGIAVRILDNFIYGRTPVARFAGNAAVEVVEGDIRNLQALVSCLADTDAVVLLAAVVGDPASQNRPTQTIETNLLATQAIAFACRSQQVNRFLYASTCSVYGKGDDLLTEASSLNPVSLYARTKIASERSILDLADGTFSPTILRMGTLYGYSPRMRFDLVVNTMSMKAFLEQKITVFGGKQWRPLLHVRDAARVYVDCLRAPLGVVGGQVFNVGSEEQNYQIDQIAQMVSDALDGVAIERQASTMDARDYRVSFERVQRAIRFRPKNTVPQAAQEIHRQLKSGAVRNPLARVYYNHYFDSTEE